MADEGNGEKITYDEIKKNFIIDKSYGTKDAYPSGRGATIIASDVEYRFPEGDNLSKKYVHRNSVQKHAEGHLIEQIHDDIEKLKERGEVREIDLRLIQNYSPCDDYENGGKRGCASDIIEFKQKLEESGKIVHITITFANFYKNYHSPNMAGLRKLRAEEVELILLQGDDNWKTFFDHDVVDPSVRKERQNLLDRAGSEARRQREEQDKKLWEEYVLQPPNAVGELEQALEKLRL